jgi:hypothetical protein
VKKEEEIRRLKNYPTYGGEIQRLMTMLFPFPIADTPFSSLFLILARISHLIYRWTSLYAKDMDQKIRLAYNEFAYKKTTDDYNVGDGYLKKGQFSIAFMQNRR